MASKKNKALDAEEKENVAPYKKFNVARQGHGSLQKNRGDGTERLECWICGKEHLKKYCLQYHSGRPQVYNAQEAQNVRDVGCNIPCIYATLDNRQTGHRASIIEMAGKICD